MKKLEFKNSEIIWSVIRYILGIIGLLGIITSILTVTGVLGNLLVEFEYKGTFGGNDILIVSLTSAVVGILFLFIGLTPYIDKFFLWLEATNLKVNKKSPGEGVKLESIFFSFIAVILLTFAILLAMGILIINPILGTFTNKILIAVLIILALLSIIMAFNGIIMLSVKELKKVHWPNLKEMKDYSLKVFSFIIFFSFLFFVLDELIGLIKHSINI